LVLSDGRRWPLLEQYITFNQQDTVLREIYSKAV